MDYFINETYKEPLMANTGDVISGGCDSVLKSSPIGSCVAVVIFDETVKAGSMAHIMLPGTPPPKSTFPNRYAASAIDEAAKRMERKTAISSYREAVVVGGGNVLKREKDTIGDDNLKSVLELLKEKQIPVVAQSVGGTNRKSVKFDIESGNIYVSEGDYPEKVFYRIKYKSS